ncbi:MAG: hypothetical protein EXS33_02615 [Pedosphaera sp.]|nr:hypothetical protein [Pedosphaera sp.]
MTLQVNIPDSLVRQAGELAERQHVNVDQVMVAALTAQISSASTRPSIADRARRVNWERVNEILDRVPTNPPAPEDQA